MNSGSGHYHRQSVKSVSVKVQIRWMIRRDMAEVLRIERESFEYHWTEEDFLCCQRRKEITLEVRETNLAAKLFFQSQDFVAVAVLRDHYEDSAEDAYVMKYRLDPEDAMYHFAPHNRISKYEHLTDGTHGES